MNSTVTTKYQTTIPKAVREKLGISVKDSLEWVIEKGQVLVRPVQSDFLRHQGSVKVGSGDISSDIQVARERQMEKHR